MTKLLTQLLEAKEPYFHQTIQSLEKSTGLPCHDIRLSENIRMASKEKIAILGLDPNDTESRELYYCLQARLKDDDAKLVKYFRKIGASNVSAMGNISEGIAYSLDKCLQNEKVFVLKNTYVKKYLLENPPKNTMKALGYRSVASMLKHESIGAIVSAALIVEPATWEKHYQSRLKTALPMDFEDRKLYITALVSSKWNALASRLRLLSRQTVIINKELGAIIILRIPNNLPMPGLTSVTLGVAIDGLNEIYSASSYLRLSQLSNNFSERVLKVISEESTLGSLILFRFPLNWETVQRFFYRMVDAVEDSPDLHLSIDLLNKWRSVDETLNRIVPDLKFWRGNDYLAYLSPTHPVSFNFLDNALSLVNSRPFGQHYTHHQRRSLWQEFVLRYINPDMLHNLVSYDLVPQLETSVVGI